ncbi:MAG: ATP-grasp domain-containing protein [Candidatus Rokubacteria bacterium]|nr:ATP-grasp domain-containing protein [Candidatus Rokubacteria bacterium]
MDRLLLLLPTRTYRTEDFVNAARALGVELVCASERPSTLEALTPDTLLTLDFADPAAAAARAVEWGETRPISAVVGVDDATTVAAAAIAERLGLRANRVDAALATRDKFQMRQCLAAAGVPIPRFRRIALADDPFLAARGVAFPCVLKPLTLSASRGVIRANNIDQFMAAFRRIQALLARDDVTVSGDGAQYLLAEQYIPGIEVALEGLLREGRLQTLALFDKPDPLQGPFFEETIYVTPSRLPDAVQARLRAVTAAACAALGLSEGPVHAELRIADDGPYVIEVAARSIGGLCSRTLRFGTGMTLEEIILRHALGWPIRSLARERRAAGVMMIPIPRAGRLRGVDGQAAAAAVPGVDAVTITMHVGQDVVPLPEGWQYLGFIFARADTPDEAEKALRAAHAHLRFDLEERTGGLGDAAG